MPPIQHICTVPHVCHWLHIVLFITGYLWPIQPAPHSLLSGWSSCQDPMFTVRLVCQDSMHSGGPSGIQALIGKWVPLRHHWPGLHHAALHLSGTWSSHLCTSIYEELVEGCGASSGLDVTTGKQGATQVSPEGWVVVQTIGKCI